MPTSYAAFCWHRRRAARMPPLPLHDALPISEAARSPKSTTWAGPEGGCTTMKPQPPMPLIQGSTAPSAKPVAMAASTALPPAARIAAPAEARSEEHTSELQSHANLVCRLLLAPPARRADAASSPARRSSDLGGGEEPEIDHLGRSRRRLHHHEAAAADAAHPGLHGAKREARRNGGVHRIAARRQNRRPGGSEIGRAHV